MEKVYNKLIRDKIVDIIERDNKKAVVHYLNDEQYKNELLNKLLEESNEVKNAIDQQQMVEELADVLEVVRYLAEISKKELSDIIYLADKKKQEKGGFDKKIFLEKTIY